MSVMGLTAAVSVASGFMAGQEIQPWIRFVTRSCPGLQNSMEVVFTPAKVVRIKTRVKSNISHPAFVGIDVPGLLCLCGTLDFEFSYIMENFPALPGYYKLLFLYLEPASTIIPAFLAWLYPGAAWFHHQLIPSNVAVSGQLTDRTEMAIWQLGNCYLLLGLISSLVFRAARDALPKDLVAQERIVGSLLKALAIADVTHIIVTFIALPNPLRFSFIEWNPMTHGNISVVIVLCAVRVCWFLGIGRTCYYYKVKVARKSQ